MYARGERRCRRLSDSRKTRRNTLIGGTLGRSFWACFPLALTVGLNSFVDTMLAGYLFSSHHLTAVGIASSVNILITAIIMILAHGSYSSYSNALGRGQRRKTAEIFTVGVILIVVLGFLLSALVGWQAHPIVRLFGAVTPELEAQAVQYLRVALFSCPINALIYLITLVVGIYGFRRQASIANLINLVSNILFSLLFIKTLPSIGLGALGLGTICADICSLGVCLLSVKTRRMPLWTVPRWAGFRWKRTKAVLVSGLTTSSNMLIDGLMAAVINNLIVGSLGEPGLAAFSVVSCFWRIAQVPADAMDYAAAPLFGILYVRRDRSALKTAGLSAIGQGIVFCILWLCVIGTLTKPLLDFFMHNSGDLPVHDLAQRGIILTLIFTPFYQITRTLTTFYDASDSVPFSLVSAIVPDSLLLPLMLALLLPSCKYPALWLSLGGNSLVFLILFYLYHLFLHRRAHATVDELFHLDDGECAEYPQIDESISYSESDISRLSEAIQRFLRQEQASSRVAYLTALCMDELATDIVSHTSEEDRNRHKSFMDVKMISEPESFQIIIRNAAAQYNPLDFEFDNTSFAKVGVMLAQRVAQKIDYDYVYSMNILSIRIAK